MALLFQDQFTRPNQHGWGGGWLTTTPTSNFFFPKYSIVSNQAAFSIPSGHVGLMNLYTYPSASPSITSGEVTFRFNVTECSQNLSLASSFGPMFRYSSPSGDFYHMQINPAGTVAQSAVGTLTIYRVLDGVHSPLSSLPFLMLKNAWYTVRAICKQSTASTVDLKIKVWKDGEDEPAAYTLSIGDTLAAMQNFSGKAGFAIYGNDGYDYSQYLDNFTLYDVAGDSPSQPPSAQQTFTWGTTATDKFATTCTLTTELAAKSDGTSDDIKAAINTWVADTDTKFLYKFAEGSGQQVVDSATTPITGTLGDSISVESADPAWTSGDDCMGGSALVFSAADTDRVVVPHNAKQVSAVLTIEAWVNGVTYVGTSRTIVNKCNDDQSLRNYYLRWYSTGAAWRFSYHNTSDTLVALDYTTTPTTGVWYHIAVTRTSGNQCTMYLDGVQVAQQTLSAPRTTTTGKLAIGTTIG
jgi:hypothetical protein